MTIQREELERTLAGAYREEAAHYGQALELSAGMPALLAAGQDIAGVLGQVDSRLQAVAAVEERIQGTRRQWQALGVRPAGELEAALVEVTGLISRLAAETRRAEELAIGERQRMLPTIEKVVRGRRMRQAYGQ